MANQSVSSFFTKFGQYVPKPMQAFTRRYVQTGSGSHSHKDVSSTAKRGLNEALRTGENLKNIVASTTEDIAENSKEAARSVAEKAKQVAQEAWESTKDTAQMSKDTALDKANHAKETVKETVDRSMNTKNNPNC